LVGVFAAGIEFAVGVFGDVEVVVGEFSALVVVAVWVCDHFLEGRGMDFVGDWFPIDRVADGGVLDFENAIDVRVEV